MPRTSTFVYSNLEVARASPFSQDFYTHIDSATSCRKCCYFLIYIQSSWVTRVVFRLIKKAAIIATVRVCAVLHNNSFHGATEVPWRPDALCTSLINVNASIFFFLCARALAEASTDALNRAMFRGSFENFDR